MAKFFEPLRDVLDVILSFDIDALALEIASTKEFQEIVIKFNTRDQLFERGENKLGRTLESIGGGYAPFTIEVKKGKGQPTNRVTLFDTGDFHASFTVKPFSGGFIIDANPIKEDTNLFDEWGEEIVGLNDENLQKVINFYKDAILEKINKKLKIN